MDQGGSNMKKHHLWLLLLILAIIGIYILENQDQPIKESKSSTPLITNDSITENNQVLVTFIELGSTNCVPCKKMQPIMKSIESKYGEQIKVIFFDVIKDKKPAEDYKVSIIPTQVFLDKSGTEIFRHVGYYPEEEIDKFLQLQGLKVQS
jgi:thioredoxin 1